MVSKIEVSPELVRLTQQRANRFNLPYRKQVARCIAEQAILELDPELSFLLDSESSLAEVDALVRALKVNDLVVNGRHIDVALLEDGEVMLSGALLDTPYLACGSLVVELDGANSGAVVGYIDPASWNTLALKNSKADLVSMSFKPDFDFDLTACLKQIEKLHQQTVDRPTTQLPKAEDYLQFSRDRRSMPIEKQRLVVAAAVSSSAVRKNIGHLSREHNEPASRVLRDSAVWEVRTIAVVEKIQEKFPGISADKIEEAVRHIGAQYGGQSQSPAFKESLLKLIARQQLSVKFPAEARAMLNSFIDKLVDSKSKVDSVRSFVKNQAAVEVARIIEEKRASLRQFTIASTEEIGFAFQQLSLQPAYATHSASDITGVESINEALHLFEAASVIEGLMEVDI